jgi:hypothetical protein
MMQIRIMRTAVHHGRVPVPMRMRLARRHVRTMRVLMVFIVAMTVLMLHRYRFVRMIVFVPLGQVQP